MEKLQKDAENPVDLKAHEAEVMGAIADAEKGMEGAGGPAPDNPVINEGAAALTGVAAFSYFMAFKDGMSGGPNGGIGQNGKPKRSLFLNEGPAHAVDPVAVSMLPDTNYAERKRTANRLANAIGAGNQGQKRDIFGRLVEKSKVSGMSLTGRGAGAKGLGMKGLKLSKDMIRGLVPDHLREELEATRAEIDHPMRSEKRLNKELGMGTERATRAAKTKNQPIMSM